jgi:hypothetical protein
MKFRFAQPTYVDNVFYEGGEDSKPVEVEARHIPGPHWQPMDDEAKAHCKKHGVTYTGQVPDMVEAMTADLQSKQAAAAANTKTKAPASADVV